LIRRDPISINYMKMLSVLDKTESERRKVYRNFMKSEKVRDIKLCFTIKID